METPEERIAALESSVGEGRRMGELLRTLWFWGMGLLLAGWMSAGGFMTAQIILLRSDTRALFEANLVLRDEVRLLSKWRYENCRVLNGE